LVASEKLLRNGRSHVNYLGHAHHSTRKDSPLKIEIAQFVQALSIVTAAPEMEAELDILRHVTVDGIITTNWDLLLENIFPDYEVYKGQDELLFSNPQSIAEIYKIHGCSTQPNSLVLTAADYQDFASRNPYLAAKLLTIFIEHPVVFLGYSLSDKNVIGILNAITYCLKSENLELLRNRLIFVQRAGGQSEQFSSTVLSIETKPLPVTVIKTDDFGQIYRALGQTKRKFPAKLLRKLKHHVYELVLENDPDERMYVAELEKESDTSRIQIVYGVGVAQKVGRLGYDTIRIEHILKDILFDEYGFDPMGLLTYTLPTLLKLSRYVPVFKYALRAGLLPDNEGIKSLPPGVQQSLKATPKTFSPHNQYAARKAEVRVKSCGVAELANLYEPKQCVVYIHFIDPKLIKLQELLAFLRDHFDDLTKARSTDLRKLVCLYDLLLYGPSQGGKAS
jgi:hypothetical protein